MSTAETIYEQVKSLPLPAAPTRGRPPDMIYLLDTCTISDFVKGHPKVIARLRETPPSDIAIST